MSFINPYRRTTNAFFLSAPPGTYSSETLFNIVSDNSGENIYAFSSQQNTPTGFNVFKFNEFSNSLTNIGSVNFYYGSNAWSYTPFYFYKNTFVLFVTKQFGGNINYINVNYLTTNSSGTGFVSPISQGTGGSGIAIKDDEIYWLNTSNFKVYKSQLTISNEKLLFSTFQLAAGGSGTYGVTPRPSASSNGNIADSLEYRKVYTYNLYGSVNSSRPSRRNSNLMTFDTCYNLYITTENSGVYKYNAGFQPTDTPIQIIPFTTCYSNILYSQTHNLLYIYNANTMNIDLFTTTGELVVKSYLSPESAAYDGRSDNSCTGYTSMTFDKNNNFYYVRDEGIGSIIWKINKTVCFKKDTQILTLQGYKRIQDLKKGDLVKTLKHEFVPIYKIGFSETHHPCNLEERVKDQLYKCSPDNYPEVFEDLILTGCHSILVDTFESKEQEDKSVELNGDLYVTDDKYRLPVCLDERATVYDVSGNHTIYHMALENDDYYMNYGIYANGLLVESTSKRFMDTIKMTLVE
jgi:hypothetical protein